jgi:mannose/cellobiose epimerase-like protein (N-acyl-D-glucosamine 2-epimerase family)
MRVVRMFVSLSVVLIAGAVSELSAQYAVHSPYLQHPEIAIAYVDSCARFWLHAYDSTSNGGFCIGLNQSGQVYSGWGQYKDVVIQSRDAYGFTRAFMLTGNEAYLTYARRALDFMYAHDWDNVNGGWYAQNNRAGAPASGTDPKAAFDQHYALVGVTALYEATRDTLDWQWLLKGYANGEKNVWDPGASAPGYFDSASYNWSTRWGKSFNATVDAITTHVLHLYLLTGDDAYRTRLMDLKGNILNTLFPTMAPQKIGFVESYHTDWSWDNLPTGNNTRTIMGHVLKTAWVLGRIHELFPDPASVQAAESLAQNVWQRGYDHQLGGPYKDYDRLTGVMMMYGQDTAKAWWQMEQAFTAGMILYDITGKDQYLQMADETVDFFMKYFVDHVYGEVFSDRSRKGPGIPAWGNDKGNSGKGGYHSTEFGYYVYLYGKLFVTHEPVTLHYKFTADSTDRVFRMNPLAWGPGKYRIGKVLLDGALYADFDPAARTVHLPPGTGGHLSVVYESVTTAIAATEGGTPSEFRLEQNYPNPFNPATTIEYRVPSAGRVSLEVYDVLGRRVAVLVDRASGPGTFTATWNAGGSPSGVYFYRLIAGGRTETRKAVLLR